jgi:nucleoside-diphosphate-sugar epimerase
MFHLYGPGDGEEKFVSAIIRDCLRDVTIDLTEGYQRRDFIFVEDAAKAIVCALNAELGNSPGYVQYDIGSGASCAIREFVETIKRLSGSHSILNFGALPGRIGEFVDACADLRAIRAIGWLPATSLEDGLRATIANYRQSVL